MISFKIMNGQTPQSGVFLCKTCTHGKYTISENGQERMICNRNFYGPVEINERIVSWSTYYNKALTQLAEMEQLAWVIVTKGGRVMGFERLTKLRADGRDTGTQVPSA